MKTVTQHASSFFKPRLEYKSAYINEYLNDMKNMRKATYDNARARLSYFEEFVVKLYNKTTADELIDKIKSSELDKYKVLGAYAGFCKHEKKGTANQVIERVRATRELLEYHGIEYSTKQIKKRVKMERGVKRTKIATERVQIITILGKIQEPFLNLALLWGAATGRRPQEYLSVRHCDLDLKRREFRIRAEYTKMGIEQVRPMTKELAERTEQFIKLKLRPRTISSYRKQKDGTFKHEKIHIEPKSRPTDLLFSPYHRDETHLTPSVDGLYNSYQAELAKILDEIGMGDRINPDDPKSPRHFTLYRLRDHVKTTISDLGHGDFGEWYIGHAGSTYYNQPEKKRLEIFAKIESYLTYLDAEALEAHGADVAAKLEERDIQIKSLFKKQEQLEMLIQSLIDSGQLKSASTDNIRK